MRPTRHWPPCTASCSTRLRISIRRPTASARAPGVPGKSVGGCRSTRYPWPCGRRDGVVWNRSSSSASDDSLCAKDRGDPPGRPYRYRGFPIAPGGGQPGRSLPTARPLCPSCTGQRHPSASSRAYPATHRGCGADDLAGRCSGACAGVLSGPDVGAAGNANPGAAERRRRFVRARLYLSPLSLLVPYAASLREHLRLPALAPCHHADTSGLCSSTPTPSRDAATRILPKSSSLRPTFRILSARSAVPLRIAGRCRACCCS